MRKFFIFAIALVASVLAFTSCNGNNPSNPGDVKLVGTMWRVDSCLMPTPVYDMGQESRYVSQPYVIIKVTSNAEVFFDESETATKYSFSEDNKTLYIEMDQIQVPFEVLELTPNFAHIRGLGVGDTDYPMDYYTGEDIYLSLIPQAEGADKAYTEANIVGTWKLDYIDEKGSYHYADGSREDSNWHRIYPSAQYHDLEIFVFNNDGTMNHTFVLERDMGMDQESWYWETTWNINDGQLCYEGATEGETIIRLTDKVMVTKTIRHNVFNNGNINHTETEVYYSRLK